MFAIARAAHVLRVSIVTAARTGSRISGGGAWRAVGTKAQWEAWQLQRAEAAARQAEAEAAEAEARAAAWQATAGVDAEDALDAEAAIDAEASEARAAAWQAKAGVDAEDARDAEGSFDSGEDARDAEDVVVDRRQRQFERFEFFNPGKEALPPVEEWDAVPDEFRGWMERLERDTRRTLRSNVEAQMPKPPERALSEKDAEAVNPKRFFETSSDPKIQAIATPPPTHPTERPRGGLTAKYCVFCYHGTTELMRPENTTLLSKFVSERGQILPKRITKCCAKHQRRLATTIKRSRQLQLMPYSQRQHPRLRATKLKPGPYERSPSFVSPRELGAAAEAMKLAKDQISDWGSSEFDVVRAKLNIKDRSY